MRQDIYTIQFIKEKLEQLGVKPTKNKGQNFVINEKVIERVVEAAGINKNDNILEIGPGLGSLTYKLAEKAKKVIAVELDKLLFGYLKEEMKEKTNVEILQGDIVKKFSLISACLANGEKYKIVANIPYQITGVLLKLILETENSPESIVLLVQKEVAERICAQPGNMSVLSVITQYLSEPTIVGVVKRGNFWPIPQVDSAIIKLKINKSINQADKERNANFKKIVKIGFANKRKMLKNNLGRNYKDTILEDVFEEIGIDFKIRAEQLTVEQWTKLGENLSE